MSTSQVNEIRSRTASFASSMLLRRLVVMFVTTASTSVVAHTVAPKDFGILSAATATYFLVLAICDFGFGMVLSRRVPQEPENTGPLVRSAIRLQLAWAITISVAVVAFVATRPTIGLRETLLVVLIPAIVSSGFAGIRQLLIIRYETRKLTAIDLGTNVGQALAVIVAMALGASVLAVAILMSVFAILNSALSLFLGRRLLGEGRSRRDHRRKILREALPLGMGSVLASMYFSIDMVLLGFLIHDESLAWYAAAVKILSMLVIIPNLLATVLLPGLSATHNDDRGKSLAAASWHWMIVTAVPVCVFAGIYAEPIVTTLFGEPFAAAADMTRILAAAGIAAVFTNVFGMLLVVRNKGKIMLLQNVFILGINVGGNLALVPRYGPIASAWLTLFTELLVCAGEAALLRSVAFASLKEARLLRPTLAIALASAVALATSQWPLPSMALTALTFLAAGTLLRAWPKELTDRLPRKREPVRTAAA